jgi:hypothetical protein
MVFPKIEDDFFWKYYITLKSIFIFFSRLVSEDAITPIFLTYNGLFDTGEKTGLILKDRQIIIFGNIF